MAEIVSQLRRQVDKWFALACPAGLRFRHAPVPVPVPAFPCGLVFRSRRSPFLPWPLQVARCSRLFRTSRHRLPFKRKRPQRKQQWPKQRLPRPVPTPATGRAFPKLYRKPSRKPRSRRRTRLLILRPNRMTRQPKPRTQAGPILQSPKQRRPYRRPRQKIQAKWQAKWQALRRPGRANRQRKSCRKQATLRWQHRRRLHLRRLHRHRRPNWRRHRWSEFRSRCCSQGWERPTSPVPKVRWRPGNTGSRRASSIISWSSTATPRRLSAGRGAHP